MAEFGAIATATAAGSVATLDTGNLAVAGTDLALVAGAGEASNGSNTTFSFSWDPAGSNEAFNVDYGDVDTGVYLDMSIGGLDDPSPGTAPCRCAFSVAAGSVLAWCAYFTGAAPLEVSDYASDSFAAAGTALSATVPNAVSGDIVVGQHMLGNQQAITTGPGETDAVNPLDVGSYARMAVSYQAGAGGGEISSAFTGVTYGGGLQAVRVPDSGGGGGPNIPAVMHHRRQQGA